MDKPGIISKTIEYVKSTLSEAEGGHDWWHTQRVWKTARIIAENENADIFITELGALLHDIADSKFHNGDEEIGPITARKFLQSLHLKEEIISKVVEIVSGVSFKGGGNPQKINSIELDIVQDADRLDALGAIGIARTFNYGGHSGRSIYNPEIKPNLNLTKEEYKHNCAPTLNHFYEKLLLLKDRMNTKTGKKMAEKRHAFLLLFLDQFYKEWNGEE